MSRTATSRLIVLAALALALLSGCKVLTIEEDRALRARSGTELDAVRYVDEIWASQALPELHAKAIPITQLLSAVAIDLDRAGGRFGRRAGEGSAWTFVVSGEGVVSEVDAVSRQGSATVALSGVAPVRAARLQIGPVVSEAAIRDALPFVAFNDFADQLAFADVGRALTARSLRAIKPAISRLRPGLRIRFLGVANIRSAGAPLVVTPVTITSVGEGRSSR